MGGSQEHPWWLLDSVSAQQGAQQQGATGRMVAAWGEHPRIGSWCNTDCISYIHIRDFTYFHLIQEND